jgi:hypothetical protein
MINDPNSTFFGNDRLRILNHEIGHVYQLTAITLNGSGGALTMVLPDVAPIDLEKPIERWKPTTDQWKEWLQRADDQLILVTDPENKKLVKAIIRKSSQQIDENLRWQTYRRDNYTCRYCGIKDRPFTYDHWLAQDYGGQTTLDNGRTSCRVCNKIKANMTIEEWIDYMVQHKMYGANTAQTP